MVTKKLLEKSGAKIRENPHKKLVSSVKIRKSEEELEGFRKALLLESKNMAQFLGWLDSELLQGTSINEYEACLKLTSIRKENDP